MSRRASFFAKLHPGVLRVRFPDEVVFDESIKESDGEAIIAMLRRASLDIDINRINMAGMTALHQAVLDENIVVIRLLLIHGANINKRDQDSWTSLHAASANGNATIVKYLLSQGADRDLLTDEGETAADLVDPEDTEVLDVLLEEQEVKVRRISLQETGYRGDHAPWFRRESLEEQRRRRSLIQVKEVGGRKASTWVHEDDIEEEEDERADDRTQRLLEDSENIQHENDGDGTSQKIEKSTNSESTEAGNNENSEETFEQLKYLQNDEQYSQQFQSWRTRRKGRLELTHPQIDLGHSNNTIS